MTSKRATGCAQRPSGASQSATGSDRVTAAVALASIAARVMPTWMVASIRFGSRDRRATARPVAPRSSIASICVGRRASMASSLPANMPLRMTSTATSTS